MATTNRMFILAAFFFSAIAAIFNIVSVSTEQWITGKAVWLLNGTTSDINYISYGLFQGNYKRSFPSSTNYQLTMTCSLSHNVCALLCGLDAEERGDLLDALYNNIVDPEYSMNNCASVSKSTRYGTYGYTPVRAYAESYNISSDSFINTGVWLSTLIFLSLAALMGFVASVLALYNTVSNPINFFLSVKSLFAYNAIAFCSTVLYMTLWGTMYNLIIFHNVAIYDTIVGSISSDKTAYLGYSYWINFVPLAFYAGSIGILYYREYLNERDPKQQMVSLEADSADPNLYLY